MKRCIAVLFGGCSDEYAVSLQSAQAVLGAIDRDTYDVCMLGITRQGRWYLYNGPLEAIGADRWREEGRCTPAVLSPDRGTHGVVVLGGQVSRIYLDAAMPVLHGKNGEDGTVQGLLELAGIPVIGCNTLASALCMDKDRAHKLAAQAGIAVPRSAEVPQGVGQATLRLLGEELGYPLFVKPVNGGSSFGVSKVADFAQLPGAVEEAFRHDSRVLLEENIPGFEVGCAVMGEGNNLTIGAVDEIELSQGFFDYTEKYNLITSSIHVPARISVQKAAEIQNTALRLYRVLGCSGFARVDLFLTPEGKIYFNEINTIPGFTAHSRFPGMLLAVGMSFPEIVNRLIAEGLKA